MSGIICRGCGAEIPSCECNDYELSRMPGYFVGAAALTEARERIVELEDIMSRDTQSSAWCQADRLKKELASVNQTFAEYRATIGQKVLDNAGLEEQLAAVNKERDECERVGRKIQAIWKAECDQLRAEVERLKAEK